MRDAIIACCTVLFAGAVSGLLACKKPSSPVLQNGKCRVETYDHGEPLVQTCHYQGYVWTCEQSTCRRGPEATGEFRP